MTFEEQESESYRLVISFMRTNGKWGLIKKKKKLLQHFPVYDEFLIYSGINNNNLDSNLFEQSYFLIKDI